MKEYLADALSLLRIVLAPFVLLLAYASEWRWAFALLVIAWTTDLFDGFAARRFGSRRDTHPDFDADGIADSVLAFGASLAPIVYTISHHEWVACGLLSALWILTLVSGITMVTVMNKPTTPAVRWIVGTNMIVFHGLVQIGAVMTWFAYMAGGGKLALATAYSLALIGILQRHKVVRWFNGALEEG